MGKLYDAIIGLVVGDALGVPYEFKQRDTFKAEGMTGFGTHNQPPGTWSDDSSMTLATLSSLLECGKICPDDIMYRFVAWLRFREYTAHDEVFDIGITTRNAIWRCIEGTPPQECGSDDEQSNGNGALMRILPLAFVPHNLDELDAVAGLTHAHLISRLCCSIYLDVADFLIHGGKKEELASLYTDISMRDRDEIKSSGYVVHTLEAALWCLLKTDSYRDCVLTAVNLGDDTDTVAAVAGGLAGILYGVGGEKGIPEEWIEQIAKHDEIKALCVDFERRPI